MFTETYPGGVTSTYAYDATGTPVSVSYSGPDWTAPLTDTIVPNAAGDWATQAITDTATSLVSNQTYSYDNAARITNVQDSLNGQCTARAYTYDADSNRTGLTTDAPSSNGTCQTSTGTTATTTYDSADRDTNTGYTYDTQGDITSTPSADADGGGNITATYYANDMLASQAQNGTTMTWALDPTEGRYASYTQGGVTFTNHYSDGSNNPTWVSASNGGWTRSLTDLNGMLAAQVTASGTTLELPDLHGDVMATATTSATSTGSTATYTYTEFGTPENGSPGTYGWLGGDQISGSALGGQLLMGVRAYNTSAGRFAQADPVAGGSANAYDYVNQNPLTGFDLTGRCDFWCEVFAGSIGGIVAGICVPIIGNGAICVGAGAGAYDTAAYWWDASNPTWSGALNAFLHGFVAGLMAGLAASAVLEGIGWLLGRFGWAAEGQIASRLAKAIRNTHSRKTLTNWLRGHL